MCVVFSDKMGILSVALNSSSLYSDGRVFIRYIFGERYGYIGNRVILIIRWLEEFVLGFIWKDCTI